MDKFMNSAQAFGDEAQREAARIKAIEAATTKHALGQVVGGRVFGYKNVDVIVAIDAHGRAVHVQVELAPENLVGAGLRTDGGAARHPAHGVVARQGVGLRVNGRADSD